MHYRKLQLKKKATKLFRKCKITMKRLWERIYDLEQLVNIWIHRLWASEKWMKISLKSYYILSCLFSIFADCCQSIRVAFVHLTLYSRHCFSHLTSTKKKKTKCKMSECARLTRVRYLLCGCFTVVITEKKMIKTRTWCTQKSHIYFSKILHSIYIHFTS